MKILVIDDSPVHQQSARQTLEGHELTVVSSYDEALKFMGQSQWENVNPRPVFDAVLTDLMMPAGMGLLGGDGMKYVGQEMPMGFGLALLAVLCSGAKLVGVVTDMTRHDHPASRLLGLLIGRDEQWVANGKPRFVMNGVTVGFYCDGAGVGSVVVPGSESPGKDWGKVLAHLLKG